MSAVAGRAWQPAPAHVHTVPLLAEEVVQLSASDTGCHNKQQWQLPNQPRLAVSDWPSDSTQKHSAQNAAEQNLPPEQKMS